MVVSALQLVLNRALGEEQPPGCLGDREARANGFDNGSLGRREHLGRCCHVAEGRAYPGEQRARLVGPGRGAQFVECSSGRREQSACFGHPVGCEQDGGERELCSPTLERPEQVVGRRKGIPEEALCRWPRSRDAAAQG